MIKLVIVDLDGTLVDTKLIHADAFIKALNKVSPNHSISHEEHLEHYDSLTTNEKLLKISEKNNLPEYYHDSIKKLKTKLTHNLVKYITKKDDKLIELFRWLKKQNILIAVASNAATPYVKKCLQNNGLIDLVDFIVTRDNVNHPKPNPEMFFKCMIQAGATVQESIIFEDSVPGLRAAHASGAYFVAVESPDVMSIEFVQKCFKQLKVDNPVRLGWPGDNIDVVIPMAGAGSRFSKAGYSLPKPLIDVQGRPMIQIATEYLRFPNARFIFIVQRSHNEKYKLEPLLKSIIQNCEIVEIDGLTEGAACTVLAAKHLINNDRHLIIANCDQYIDFDCAEFMYQVINRNAYGSIVTFEQNDGSPKWSYAKVDSKNLVQEVAEKKVISNIATAGVYHFRYGKDFVESAENMINKNFRINNEFYVCPVYNELLNQNKPILNHFCNEMHGLGTPEDLELFLRKK